MPSLSVQAGDKGRSPSAVSYGGFPSTSGPLAGTAQQTQCCWEAAVCHRKWEQQLL